MSQLPRGRKRKTSVATPAASSQRPMSAFRIKYQVRRLTVGTALPVASSSRRRCRRRCRPRGSHRRGRAVRHRRRRRHPFYRRCAFHRRGPSRNANDHRHHRDHDEQQQRNNVEHAAQLHHADVPAGVAPQGAQQQRDVQRMPEVHDRPVGHGRRKTAGRMVGAWAMIIEMTKPRRWRAARRHTAARVDGSSGEPDAAGNDQPDVADQQADRHVTRQAFRTDELGRHVVAKQPHHQSEHRGTQ